MTPIVNFLLDHLFFEVCNILFLSISGTNKDKKLARHC